MEHVSSTNNFNAAVEFLAWIAYEGKSTTPAYVESFGFLLGRQAFKNTVQKIVQEEGEKTVAKFCSNLRHSEYTVRVFDCPTVSKDSLFVGFCVDEEQRVLIAAGFNPAALDVDNEEIIKALGTGFEAGVLAKMVSDEQAERKELDALIDNTVKEIFG